jgi:hypothetical protein
VAETSPGATAAAPTSSDPLILNNANRKKRRKVDVLVEGGYCDKGDSQWECLTCGRRLTTEQGAKTHVYTMHILDKNKQQQQQQHAHSQQCDEHQQLQENEGAHAIVGAKDVPLTVAAAVAAAGDVAACFATSETTASFQCVECGKPFSNCDALYQHKVAKHSGSYTSLKPEWVASNIVESNSRLQSENSTTVHACDICGLAFDDAAQLEMHMEGWSPIAPSSISFDCGICASSFASERALRQHENFCRCVSLTVEN